MTSDCPDLETLELLLLGNLPSPMREQLGEHLLNCDDCAAAAETLSANDELTFALQAEPMIHGDEDIVAQVMSEIDI